MTDSGVKRDRPPSNEVDENENNVKPSPSVLANQKKRPTFLWRKKLSVLQKSAKWGKLQNTDPTVCQSTFRMCVFVLVDFLGTAFFSPLLPFIRNQNRVVFSSIVTDPGVTLRTASGPDGQIFSHFSSLIVFWKFLLSFHFGHWAL